jgi:hypothetical protein
MESGRSPPELAAHKAKQTSATIGYATLTTEQNYFITEAPAAKTRLPDRHYGRGIAPPARWAMTFLAFS